MSLPKIYDWERVRAALKLLAETFPDEFSTWVLIGGGACWFYRQSLQAANDPDFQVPPVRPEDEIHWLSKDVDFMGFTESEATDLLRAPFKPDTHTISFRGLEIDFLEEGLRLTPGLAQAGRREVRATDFTFFVLEPALLYLEKCALLASKARPQDRLHHVMMAEYLKYEFCSDAERPAKLEAGDWIASARTVKTADLNFFSNDARFNARLSKAIAALMAPEHRALKHWARHHLPGFVE